jgi:Gas vesicle synthesis protein GvpO
VTEERDNPAAPNNQARRRAPSRRTGSPPAPARRRAPSRGPGDTPAPAGDRKTRNLENDDDTRLRPLGGIQAARRAADDLVKLTGTQSDHVVSVMKQDDGWHVGLEVVELHRIPDSADVLALYEVILNAHGELVTCRRGRRYLRGSTDEFR